MKIAFFGTGDFSKNILSDLLKDSRVEVKLVVSQPDKPVGRKKILEKTPVKILAEENNIEVLQPEKLRTGLLKDNKTSFLDYIDSLELDFILVVAYGKIVPKRVLESAKYGCINLHGSILPNYRGASPIQESVKNGDSKTGLTVMFMSKGMDEGDILKIEEVLIDKDDKTSDIFEKFESFGAELAIETLESVRDGKIKGVSQEHEKATYCSKISKEDGEINFENQTADEIYNKYRAYYNWPGIFNFYNGKKINFEEIEIEYIDLSDDIEFNIGEVVELENEHNSKNKRIGVIARGGIIILKQIKLEGKKSMDIISFVNGNKDFLDYKF